MTGVRKRYCHLEIAKSCLLSVCQFPSRSLVSGHGVAKQEVAGDEVKDSSLPRGPPPSLQSPDCENTQEQDHPGLNSRGAWTLQLSTIPKHCSAHRGSWSSSGQLS